MSVAIVVQNISDNQSVPPESSFTQWVGRVFADVRVGEVAIRIVDEEEIHGLNRQYRGKDAATNVLSFAYENDANDESEDLPIGDIVICAPIIEREAQEQGKPISAHWAHIAIHGALHLCGFDHETEAQAEAMEARESSLLAEFGFANPYRSLAQRHTGLQDRPYSNG